LRVSGFDRTFHRINHETSLDLLFAAVHPEDRLRERVVVYRFNVFLLSDHFNFPLPMDLIGVDVFPVGVDDGHLGVICLADSALLIGKSETAAAGTRKRAIQIAAELRTEVLSISTFIDI